MIKILKGNILFTATAQKFEVYEQGYLIIEDEIVREVAKELPACYKDITVEDMGQKLIIPGFVDVHVHAPQLKNVGLGLDEELLPWLQKYTFPLEACFENEDYAKKSYEVFVNELWKNGTTRAIVFATKHKESTKLLFDMLKQSGLGAFVGKVNMDRNAIDELTETAAQSIEDTLWLVENCEDPSGKVQYMLTPRFVPCTTQELMKKLGELGERYDLPVQSHLCENRNEVAWVKELHPKISTFGKVYDTYGLLREEKTVMAHCIYLSKEEIDLMVDKKIMAAHCPQSNIDLASGIMPIRRYLEEGMRVGIGSDVGGGHYLSIAKQLVTAIGVSKLHWVQNPQELPLSLSEAFYLATKGGGSFFGKVGSFEAGYAFDALVIDDQNDFDFAPLALQERLARFLYTGDDRHIVRRYVSGKAVEKPFPNLKK